MGGRIYDPRLGRFLQADPFIQAPKNTQSYNRYSYVLNNPLSYTDPSGYFFKKLFKGLLGDTKVGKLAFQIGITIATSGAGLGWAVAGGALSGYVATGSLKGALIGALSSAVFFGAGEIIANNGLKNLFARGAIRGLTGGVTSVLSGGKFGHGFAAAGVSSFAGGKIDSLYKTVGARVIASAVVGGTVSQATGGKFANGAITAAFMRGYNKENHKTKSQVKAGDQSPLGDFFRSLSKKIAAFRGHIESAVVPFFQNSHAGPTVGGAFHLGLAGYTNTEYLATDGNLQICLVNVECGRFGPGVLADGGPGFELNLANTPQLAEGNTETTIGVFIEGGPGIIGGGSRDIGTHDLMPSVGIGVHGYGAGLAGGVQVCHSEVQSCF